VKKKKNNSKSILYIYNHSFGLIMLYIHKVRF